MDYLFYTCLLLFATDVRGVITNAPLNAVAEVGQQAIFNCTSDLPSPNWVLSAKREDLIASAGKTIVYGCVVQTGFTTHYYVDRPGGNINICNLIVNDTTMQQAGIYTCTDSAPGPSAILTVTDKLINATYNTTAGVVVEKENVIIECVLNYNGTLSPAPTLRPYFYWTDFNEQNVSSSYNSTTDDTAVSQLTVTAGRQNITSYTCHVYFQPMPPTNTGYASNTPTVSNSATSIITVFYYPIISSITKVPACPGETVVNLTCNATAYPAPTYSWIGPDSRNYSGQTIEVVMNGSYTCNASNVIRGSTHWDTKTETQTNASQNNASAENNASDPPDYECHPKSIIVIIVAAVLAYLVGNFIATVIFLSCYHQNIRFKLKMNDRFSWLREMLSCMNENVACRCHWICLSVLVFTLFGILFISSILAVEKCSRKRRRSEASFQQFQKGSDLTDGGENLEMENNQSGAIGPKGDATYAQIDAGVLSQDNSRKVRDRKKQQKGEENGKSVDQRKNPNRPFDGVGNPGGDISKPMFDAPTSSPPNPQHMQPPTAPGTVYSDLPIIGLNIQPEQYLQGNKDNPTYSELNKA